MDWDISEGRDWRGYLNSRLTAAVIAGEFALVDDVVVHYGVQIQDRIIP